jgi:hypothetical protein
VSPTPTCTSRSSAWTTYTRRLISTVGWPLAIDAGLGTGPADFNAILLRRFPAAVASHQVPGWAEPRAPARKPPEAPALNALEHDDGCGMAELAGTAVGAAFVGVTTACLAITEAVCAVLGCNGYEIINLHLQSGDLNHAPATEAADVIPARLS